MKIYTDDILSEKIIKKLVLYALELVKNYNKDYSTSVLVHQNNGIHVTVRSGLLEYLEFNNDITLSLTIYNDYQKSTVSFSNFSLDSIKLAVIKAIELLQFTSKDDCNVLPESNLLAFDHHDLKLYYPCEINIKNIVDLTKNLEQFALSTDSRIFNTEGSSFFSNIHTIVLGNTYGMLNSYKTSTNSLSISLIAKENQYSDYMERDYDYTIARKYSDLLSINTLGSSASKKVIARLGSKKISTRKVPLLFSSELSSSFFSHFICAITGSNVYRKNTCLLDSLNKPIFPNWLNIIDDPHIKKDFGSKPFDSEGVKTKKFTIVKDGVLKTWLLDTYFSKKLNLCSTGHSGGIHNWLILGQSILNLEELFKLMDCGIYITELMGDGVNLITGTYSRGAFGFWIENGKIKYPVSEITISSNLQHMWKNIISIGNNVDIRSQIKCGSILLSEMQVSGK